MGAAVSQAAKALGACQTALEMIASVATEDIVRKLAERALSSLHALAEADEGRREKQATRKRLCRGPVSLRAKVLARDSSTCRYCGAPASTIDHVIPICQGGPHAEANLVAACKACNSRKSGRTPEQAGMVLQ